MSKAPVLWYNRGLASRVTGGRHGACCKPCGQGAPLRPMSMLAGGGGAGRLAGAAPSRAAAAGPQPGQWQTEVLSIDPAALAAAAAGSTLEHYHLPAAAPGEPGSEPAPPAGGSNGAGAPSGGLPGALAALHRAAALLSQGLPVAIPTETVYGLAADATSAEAVGRVFAAKGRPADNPLIVHVSDLAMLRRLYPGGEAGALPAAYAEAARRFWPGPLTLLLPASPLIPGAVTAGQPSLAVRMPSHPVARALIAACGFPLAAPSANTSGRPSPTTAAHVAADLAGRVPLILDGGPAACGLESTVLDALRAPPAVLRPGGVTAEALAALPGLQGLQVYAKSFTDARLEEAPTTPGMKYQHYSPSAPVTLLDPQPPQLSGGKAGGVDGGSTAGGGPCSSGGASSSGASRAPGVQAQAGDAGAVARLRGVLQAAADGEAAALLGSGAARRVVLLRSSCQPGQPPGWLDPGGVPPAAAAADPNGSAAAGTAAAGAQPGAVLEYCLGSLERPAELGSGLFAALRAADDAGADAIVVEGCLDVHEGTAVMNRLRKAASRVVALPQQPSGCTAGVAL